MDHVLAIITVALWSGAPLALNAASIEWVTTREEALDRAAEEGKRVLLLAGRETCSNCRAMKYNLCEEPAARAIIDRFYVPWYCPIDDNTEWHSYAIGLLSFTLPLIAVVDPDRPNQYLERTTGLRSGAQFQAFLEEWRKPAPPVLGIRAGEEGGMQLFWQGRDFMVYQLEYSLDGGENWSPLGEPIAGSAQPEVVVPIQLETQAYFRVMTRLGPVNP
jgi:hypothetical protein